MPPFCLLWLGFWGKGFGNSSCAWGWRALKAGDHEVRAAPGHPDDAVPASPADTNVLRYIQLTQLKMNRRSLQREDSGAGAGAGAGPGNRDVIG